jgi:hypothetical protein
MEDGVGMVVRLFFENEVDLRAIHSIFCFGDYPHRSNTVSTALDFLQQQELLFKKCGNKPEKQY